MRKYFSGNIILMSILIGSAKKHNPKLCTFSPPTRSEFDVLSDMKNAFESLGIKVSRPNYHPVVKSICRSIWVRDSSVNINNNIILLPGWSKGRMDEWKTHPYASHSQSQIAPHNQERIEGGDIIQHGDLIIIGLGMRTNIAGVRWLKQYLRRNGLQKTIITVKHTTLHLDCCLCVLPNGELIYSQKYIKNLPVTLKGIYDVYTVEHIIGQRGQKCQTNLATNIVIIDNNLITTDQQEFVKLREFLRYRGYNVIEIRYGNMSKLGGGIRCLTQWLKLPCIDCMPF